MQTRVQALPTCMLPKPTKPFPYTGYAQLSSEEWPDGTTSFRPRPSTLVAHFLMFAYFYARSCAMKLEQIEDDATNIFRARGKSLVSKEMF